MMKIGTTFLDHIENVRKEKFMSQEFVRWPLTASQRPDDSSLPKYAHLNVTNRCNSSCIYCIHAANKKNSLPQADVSTEKMKRVLQQIANLGVESVNFSGGEPLLRQDIFDLINFSEQIGLVSILLTNGLLLPRYWQVLGKTKNRYLIISIDTFDPVLYKKQRGVPFVGAWKGFQTALKLRDRFPSYVINITTTVTKNNLEELPSLAEKFSSYGIGIEFSPLHDLGVDSLGDNTPSNSTLALGVIEKLLEMRATGSLIVNSQEYLKHFPAFFRNPYHLPAGYICYCADVCLYIDACLNVKPCWSSHLPAVGNLESTELTDVWFSPFFNEQRERIKRLDCGRCWLLCTAEPSLRYVSDVSSSSSNSGRYG